MNDLIQASSPLSPCFEGDEIHRLGTAKPRTAPTLPKNCMCKDRNISKCVEVTRQILNSVLKVKKPQYFCQNMKAYFFMYI